MDDLYRLENCFDRRAMETPDGRRKAQLFAALVPADCRTILDAGGGTGWATAGLRERCQVVTLDSSPESLALAPGETMLASVDALPYADNAFDLVLSSQVLEHLPDEILNKARSEMARVARRYLMVSVPYREALEARFVRCHFCQHEFHPDHHCRSFSEEDLARLFLGWLMAEWHVFGPLSWGMGVNPLRSENRRYASTHELPPATSFTICPKCNMQGIDGVTQLSITQTQLSRRIVKAIAGRLLRILRKKDRQPYPTFLPQSVAPYWITAIFIREESEPLDAGFFPPNAATAQQRNSATAP